MPPASWYRYEVAGIDTVSDARLGAICHLSISQAERLHLPTLQFNRPDPATATIVYQGLGQFANGFYDLSCWFDDGHFLLKVKDQCELIVTQNAEIVSLSTGHINRSLLMEVLLGPALALGLAIHDIFCLHSSAVEVAGSVCAFMGESGHGKSTLSMCADSSWKRLSDDVTPVCIQGSAAYVRPHFPQLKLSSNDQYSLQEKTDTQLREIFLLQPFEPETENDSIEFRRLRQSDAALALVRHTVAAKLFCASLLERHLQFVSAMAERVSVTKLAYPLSMGRLAEMRCLISERACQ
ncbi:MAG: hypothetical protein OEU36_22025 [Gammaproteobacteria bacterium]|nr:hypothetical protein [Gammaproteobacteria bacterium]